MLIGKINIKVLELFEIWRTLLHMSMMTDEELVKTDSFYNLFPGFKSCSENIASAQASIEEITNSDKDVMLKNIFISDIMNIISELETHKKEMISQFKEKSKHDYARIKYEIGSLYLTCFKVMIDPRNEVERRHEALTVIELIHRDPELCIALPFDYFSQEKSAIEYEIIHDLQQFQKSQQNQQMQQSQQIDKEAKTADV